MVRGTSVSGVFATPFSSQTSRLLSEEGAQAVALGGNAFVMRRSSVQIRSPAPYFQGFSEPPGCG